MMPGMSGLEMLRRLRSDERTRLIPVVLVTSLNAEEDRIKGIEMGCNDFISKPFDKIELIARVRSLLKISYYRRSLDEKEKFEYVMEHMPDGLVILNSDLKIKRVNRKAEALLGFISEEADLMDFLSNFFQLNYLGHLRKDLLARGLYFEAEKNETQKERPLILGVSTGVIKNPAGEVSDIVFLIQDITEQKRREFQQLDFLTLMSHKLRTPMSILSGNIDLLHDESAGALNKGQADIIEVLVRKSRELIEGFAKMIGFVGIQQNKKILPTGKIRLKERLEKIVRKTEEIPGLSLQINCPEALEFETNEAALSQILKNLLENAVKFNSKEKKEVFLEASSENSAISIKVRDNGDGIPREEIEKIFDVFYQIDKHRTGNVPGYGVGLAIVRSYVQGLGGSIRVESEIGKGSTFILMWPAPNGQPLDLPDFKPAVSRKEEAS
jgi:two-component system, cell cycle response regulator